MIESDDPIVLDVDAESAGSGPAGGPAAVEDSGGDLVPAAESLPDWIPILPLRNRPFFPNLPAPLQVQGEQVALVRHALESAQGTLGMVLLRDPSEPETGENLFRVGTAAKLVRSMLSGEDTAHVLAHGIRRFTLQEVKVADFGLMGRVEYHEEAELARDDELRAYGMAIIATLKELVSLNPLQSEAIRMFLGRSSLDDPGRLADFAVNLTTAESREMQGVLETFDVRRRVDRVLVLLKKEVEIARLQGEISQQIEEKITKGQREFFLREQLKAIKKELGLEKEGKAAEIDRFRERLEERTLPPDVQSVVDEEIAKFQLLEPASPEYTVSRNYLDWLTVLPWGMYSEDGFDLTHAGAVLERDHHGLDDVKLRILEFIAVGKLKGEISGSILCLVGPPGVGKTSIGRSIADAVGRRFYRFSLGGMRDEAEIKGHRRTYIGAMPGKFIQAMKTVGTSNPVIMLDEIDKVGASFQGDPASALLEVLDPEQNSSFRDHYLDVPFDLSDVLFVATANLLDTIPAPLLDRMEVIRLAGYILEEKVEIARRYLVPRSLESHGIKPSQVRIRRAALRAMVDGYAREAGVRGLEKLIKKILRKAAMTLAEDPGAKVAVGKGDLEGYLGKPIFTPDRLFRRTPGVVTGLAWTSHGGATLQIEATAVPSTNHGFRQTGQLGDVMRESAQIAYSYVMAHLEAYGASPDYFGRHFVHLHVPAGATPKDGPSAGITMATALISMVTGKPVPARLAMTGELTLTGHVLPIGGIKEKVIASRRAGLKLLIFPEANRGDFEELPEYLRNGLDARFAARFEEVHEVAFGGARRAGPRA